MSIEPGMIYKRFKVNVAKRFEAGYDADFHVSEMEQQARKWTRLLGFKEVHMTREYVVDSILSVTLLGKKEDVEILPDYVV